MCLQLPAPCGPLPRGLQSSRGTKTSGGMGPLARPQRAKVGGLRRAEDPGGWRLEGTNPGEGEAFGKEGRREPKAGRWGPAPCSVEAALEVGGSRQGVRWSRGGRLVPGSRALHCCLFSVFLNTLSCTLSSPFSFCPSLPLSFPPAPMPHPVSPAPPWIGGVSVLQARELRPQEGSGLPSTTS